MADLASIGRAPTPENASEARIALQRAWVELQSTSDYLRSTDWVAFERTQPSLGDAFRLLIVIDRELARLDGE